MRQLALETKIGAFSATAGLEGKLFGDFAWDTHYTHGYNSTKLTSINNVNSANFYAAVDAVRDPSTRQYRLPGQHHCAGRLPGLRAAQPVRRRPRLEGSTGLHLPGHVLAGDQRAWTISAPTSTGTVFDGWAGPWKVAVGGAYRRASLRVTSSVPNNSFNPQRSAARAGGQLAAHLLSGSNLGYFKEVQSGATGREDVYEGNIEVNVPLLKDVPLVEMLAFNGAYRYTRYDAVGNGNVDATFSSNTWKLGLEWKVSQDLKFRVTRSRDIRAPTLWDLYQAQVISASGVSDPLTNTSAQLNTLAGGNPNLKPEVAQNFTAGAVLTPRFMPGFSLSFDYFHVKIGNAIGAVAGTNPIVQSLCLASDGSSPYCALLVRPISYNNTSPANFPTLNISLSQNIAQVEAKGFDVEANYTTELLSGRLNLRALWTHQPTLTTVTIPGAVITNAAGDRDPAGRQGELHAQLPHRPVRLRLPRTLRLVDQMDRQPDPGLRHPEGAGLFPERPEPVLRSRFGLAGDDLVHQRRQPLRCQGRCLPDLRFHRQHRPALSQRGLCRRHRPLLHRRRALQILTAPRGTSERASGSCRAPVFLSKRALQVRADCCCAQPSHSRRLSVVRNEIRTRRFCRSETLRPVAMRCCPAPNARRTMSLRRTPCRTKQARYGFRSPPRHRQIFACR